MKYSLSRNMLTIRHETKFLTWLGSGHPSVLWHCFIDSLRYFLIKRGILSGAAKHVAQIRAEFEENVAHGQFESLLFDANDWNIVQWCGVLSKTFNRADPVRILEIGSWEGRSALFFLTYFTQGNLTAVDPWDFSAEFEDSTVLANVADAAQGAGTAHPQLRPQRHYHMLQTSETRFDSNLAPYKARLTKRKGISLNVLPQLVAEEQEFDVIYVDGSHLADDVLTDAINAWRLLKQGGIMIFDDVLWDHFPRARANPAWALRMFLKYHKGEYSVLNAFYQITLQKKKSFTDHLSADIRDSDVDRAMAATLQRTS